MIKNEDQIIRQAITILETRFIHSGEFITNPEDAQHYLILKLAELEYEVFSVIFMNTRHEVIEYREMFRGTVNGASVHPREVVKAALALNASALIFAHNHPSGNPEPSQADRGLTERLSNVLEVLEIRVLDHLIVGDTSIYSFAENGLL